MSKTLYTVIPFILISLVLVMVIILLSVSSKIAIASNHSALTNEIIVTTLEDELNNDGDCSLREAIKASNDNTAADACMGGDAVAIDTIAFVVTGTVRVYSQLSVAAGGPLVIDGSEEITISGGGNTRVIEVEPGSELTMQSLSVAHGYIYANGAGIYSSGILIIINSSISSNAAYYNGGGIFNSGSLTIAGSSLYGNSAHQGDGGGIYNTGIMTITESTLAENTISIGNGGGIYNTDLGTFSISSSTITGNDVNGWSGGGIYNASGSDNALNKVTLFENRAYYGGGLYNTGTLIITESVVSNNSGSYGGGINNNNGKLTMINSAINGHKDTSMGGGIYANGSVITIINSTISNNASRIGGGFRIDNYSSVSLINSTVSENTASLVGGGININVSTLYSLNCTLSENSAPRGGGILLYGNVTLVNTIVANSLSGGDCRLYSGGINDGGHNLDSDGTCGLDPANGSLPNTNPLLGSLHDHSGPTMTHGLLWNSPAIDAGDNAQCPSTDQRGVFRPQDGNGDGLEVCDIGSFELFWPIYLIYEPLVNNER